ncbi:MAG: hypothetical protein Q7S99_13450 [Parvibaculum sp.]|nr:hypothetical protein [Parvibaculum sp.]
MPDRSDQWHLEIDRWYLWLLVPFFFVAALAVALISKLFGMSNAKARTPQEVVGYVRDFIEGTGGEWDWDDFTSISIEDPRLEAIRMDAEMVHLPAGPEQIEELKQLLIRAEAIRLEDWRLRVAAPRPNEKTD